MKSSDRNLEIMARRREGKSYREIGELYGITADRARTVAVLMEREMAEGNGLSVRARNILRDSFGLEGDTLTPDQDFGLDPFMEESAEADPGEPR